MDDIEDQILNSFFGGPRDGGFGGGIFGGPFGGGMMGGFIGGQRENLFDQMEREFFGQSMGPSFQKREFFDGN